MKGMSDWSLCELEDIDWDGFGTSDDHIVPHRGGPLVDEPLAVGDACKKPRHEVENDVGRSMYNRGSATKTLLRRKDETIFPPPMKDESSSILEKSWSHTSEILVPTSCEPSCFSHVTALASQDARISNHCVKDHYPDTNKDKLCLQDSSMGKVSPNGCKACHFSLENVSPDVTDLPFVENEQKVRENDLLYYDWPEVGNFEDVDIMLRNWDSSFGQGHAGTADELSWFSSSSHAIYGSEITFEPAADHDKPSDLGNGFYADWLDANDENKCKSTLKEEVSDGGNEICTFIPNENGLNGCEASNMMGSQNSSEERRTEIVDQKPLDSDTSATQAYSSHQLPKQNHFEHFVECASSNHLHTLNPHAQVEFNLPTHQMPFAQITSSTELKHETKLLLPPPPYEASNHVANCPTQCMERLPDKFSMLHTMPPEKSEKVHQRQQLCDAMNVEHPNQHATFRSKASVHNKNRVLRHETKCDNELEDISRELPTVEIDSSTVQESSCMTSDNISPEATSFRQLQDVMHQLDVRTKLCIRDSLYRLARSAKQRHTSSHTNNCSRGSNDSRGIQGAEASKKYADLMDAETDTNPIDRSIAHLLFHKPSEPTTGSPDDAMSLESHIILHVPVGNKALMHDQFDQQKSFGGSSNMEILSTDLP